MFARNRFWRSRSWTSNEIPVSILEWNISKYEFNLPWPDTTLGGFAPMCLRCPQAKCPAGPRRRSGLLGVSQLCKQSITSDGKWITTHYLCSCTSGTQREHIPKTDWNGLSGAREERPPQSQRKASIRIMDKVLLLYCTIALREAMFYCSWLQTPIRRKYPIGMHLTGPPWLEQKPLMLHYETCSLWLRGFRWIIKSWSYKLQHVLH